MTRDTQLVGDMKFQQFFFCRQKSDNCQNINHEMKGHLLEINVRSLLYILKLDESEYNYAKEESQYQDIPSVPSWVSAT